MHDTRTVPLLNRNPSNSSSAAPLSQVTSNTSYHWTSTSRPSHQSSDSVYSSSSSLPCRPYISQLHLQSRYLSHHPSMGNVILQLTTSACLNRVSILPTVASPSQHRRKRVALGHAGILAIVSFTLLITICYACWATPGVHRIIHTLLFVLRKAWHTLCTYDWKGAATFHITPAMRTSVALSLILGVLLGIAVGVVSGLEPAVVVGVSASMAIGCVFVMSFAVIHGVNALRAISFALFVSLCLPFGFGFGFGVGILVSIFFGLEDPEDVADKTKDFIHNFPDFIKVVAAFTLEIL